MTVDEIEREELLELKDGRGKKDRKRNKKESKEKELWRENKKMREEIDKLRKKVDEQSINKSNDSTEKYALGFDKEKYLNLGFIESAKWVRTFLAKKMNEKMLDEKYELRFGCFIKSKSKSRTIGMRTCARYNRGEECMRGRWHSTHLHQEAAPWQSNRTQEGGHQDRQPSGSRYDLRVHACTLCLEALGSINGHSILDCPWILEKNWNE